MTVGVVVGVQLGDVEGLFDGIPDGAVVGRLLGIAEGTFDGLFVLLNVGRADGIGEGAAVGSVVIVIVWIDENTDKNFVKSIDPKPVTGSLDNI